MYIKVGYTLSILNFPTSNTLKKLVYPKNKSMLTIIDFLIMYPIREHYKNQVF